MTELYRPESQCEGWAMGSIKEPRGLQLGGRGFSPRMATPDVQLFWWKGAQSAHRANQVSSFAKHNSLAKRARYEEKET